MKLKDEDIQPAMAGLPASHREWWDLGDGYEVYVDIDENECGVGIHAPSKHITYEVAKYLGLNVAKEDIKFGEKAKGRELYLTLGIDCVVLNYTKPENYKELLKKIEAIVNECFKHK